MLTRENLAGTGKSHMKWAGHDSINENTGLTYMQARWMDNNTGRFISMDPIKDGYNWYAYCAGNPVSYTDPTGLEGVITTYTVKDGDRLWEITDYVNSQNHTEFNFQDIADYNGLSDPDSIYPGDVLRIPSGTNSSSNVAISGALAIGTGPGTGVNNGGKKDGGAKKKNTVREQERNPDLGVMQTNYNKARAANNGFVHDLLLNYLRNVSFDGNGKSTDAFTTGNSGDDIYSTILKYPGYSWTSYDANQDINKDWTRESYDEFRVYFEEGLEEVRGTLEDNNLPDEIPEAWTLKSYSAKFIYYRGKLVGTDIRYEVKNPNSHGVRRGIITHINEGYANNPEKIVTSSEQFGDSFDYSHKRDFYKMLASGAAVPNNALYAGVCWTQAGIAVYKLGRALPGAVKSAPNLLKGAKYGLAALLGLGDDGVRAADDIVYRVIRPDEDIALGLFAKNRNAAYKLEGHVLHGSKESFKSQFISTTNDINVAKKWAQETGNRIVSIDLSKVPRATVYDLSSVERASQHLRGATAKAWAVKSREVVILGDIPAEAIKIIQK